MWEHLGERYLLKLGIEPREGISAALHDLSLDEGARLLREEYALTYSPEEILRQIRRMTESFYLSEVQPTRGARELLEALKAQRMLMSVATAGDCSLAEAALERLGLRDYFAGFASCAEYGGKSSPEVYFAAAEMIFAEPHETIVFEDALYAVRTAKNAGFVTAAVFDICEKNQEELRSTADYYFNDLSECIGVIT
jgi:HAD superfamily hydrolase (TIGR01509 family)